MTQPIAPSHPLHRWFSGLVENAMYAEVGMVDPGVTEYLADLLTQFIHADRIFALKTVEGRSIDQVADMLAASAESLPNAPAAAKQCMVHRHIGDFTLFWTGVFPENLRRLCSRSRKDHMIDYFQQGKKSYAIASELCAESTRPPASLLRRLSDKFEYCVHGLGLVREEVRSCALAPGMTKAVWM